ncbi:unnamed protein product, partial [marine sediment metagenome]
MGDVNKYAVGRAKKVCLYHGTPLKRIGYDDEIAYPLSYLKGASNVRKFVARLANKIDPNRRWSFDMLIASSEESKQNHCSAFRVESNRVYVTGYPRNDALLDTGWPNSRKIDYIDSIKNEVVYEYVFTYLPTFRDSHRGNPNLFVRYNFDTNAIHQILERLNAILIVKPHSADNKLNLPADEKTMQRIYSASDEELPDIYPILSQTDVLITDYSGVYFDYLLLNRPIIFAPFDINQYVKEDRG